MLKVHTVVGTVPSAFFMHLFYPLLTCALCLHPIVLRLDCFCSTEFWLAPCDFFLHTPIKKVGTLLSNQWKRDCKQEQSAVTAGNAVYDSGLNVVLWNLGSRTTFWQGRVGIIANLCQSF